MEHSQVGGAEAEVVDDDGDFGSPDMELEGLQGDAEVDDLLLEGEAHPPPAVEEQPSNGSEYLAKNNGVMVDDLFSSSNSKSWLHAYLHNSVKDVSAVMEQKPFSVFCNS